MSAAEDLRGRAHPFLAGGPKRLLIGGAWVESASGETFETLNPATGAPLAQVARGGEADIDRAVAAARAAFEGGWGLARPVERQLLLLRLADLVERHFDEIAWLETLDMGAPIRHSRGSRDLLVGMLRWYAGMATALYGQTVRNSAPDEIFSCVVKEPVGVVGGIIPWNGPLWATIWKVGPALATGCTLVLKPAEEAPLSPLRFGELLEAAGMPPGVVNIVPGGAAAGAALAAHPGVDKISFTGSHPAGQSVARAAAGNLKRVTLELGGKSPNIVFADADLGRAAPAAAGAIFANAGQICSAGSLLYVERPIYETFVAEVARLGASLRIGDGLDPATELGPLVSPRQCARVVAYLESAREEGAVALTGGARLVDGALAQGSFVAPTVLSGVTDGMRVAREEVFGPVLAAIPFDGEAEVAARANAGIYGLGAGIWTRDVGRAHRLGRALRAGSVWVNCYNVLDPAMPFGGYKMSGYGRESGLQQLDDYMSAKGLWIRSD